MKTDKPMTAEKILDDLCEELIARYPNEDYESVDKMKTFPEWTMFIEAMHTFAEQEAERTAIEFMQWVLKEGWNLFGEGENRFWRLYSEAKTTAELYQLFQQKRDKK